MRRSTCTLAIVLFLICISNAQEIFYSPNYAFDCYGEVKLPESTKILYVYDGVDPNIETKEFIVKEATGKTKWVKKKADKNCLSANPEDCLVWCLVEDNESIIYNILIDTSATTEWYPQSYTIREKGKTKKVQVLCKDELTFELLDALKNKLISLDYDLKPNKKYKKLRGKFMREFKRFQEDYNLPIGKWNVATMELLYDLKS